MEIWGSTDATRKKMSDKKYYLVGKFPVSDKDSANFPEFIMSRLRSRGYRFIKVKTLSGDPPQVFMQTDF